MYDTVFFLIDTAETYWNLIDRYHWIQFEQQNENPIKRKKRKKGRKKEFKRELRWVEMVQISE